MDECFNGLRTGIRNALEQHGFKSREEVLIAFRNGEIHFRNPGGGGTVRNLGKKGVVELRMWLGLPPTEVNLPPKMVLELAIKICEESGYTVTPKD